MTNPTEYFAFISYKRGCVDESVANWIHTKLEKYPYPKSLVLPENRPQDKELIRSVFIDTKELHVSEDDFADEIKEALKHSRYLILICSKVSAASKYVNREVEYFLETHDNDSTKILPVFIDKVEDNLPHKLKDTDILLRHCPIYNTFLDQTNEINLYCFYHIVSFLLKVDFREIYDRYKRYAETKQHRRKWLKYGINTMIALIIALLVLLAVFLGRLVNRQKAIVRLEKEIFPYSVVTGYTKNFLLPVVDYFSRCEPEAHMFIHMPTRAEDLVDNHQKRFDNVSAYLEKRLDLDSISEVKLKTKTPKGSSVIHKMYSSTNDNFNHYYLDVATTTTAFLEIAKMKKSYKPYEDANIDDMIEEYTNTFISKAKEMLKQDSMRVSFVKTIYEMENKIMQY